MTIDEYALKLAEARVENDRKTITIARLTHRVGQLETENEAIRDLVAKLAASQGGARL